MTSDEFKPIFVVGMFRSATTLITKALNVHSKINVVADPFFQFFKEYRNEVFHSQGYNDFDGGYPISDNFFSEFSDVNNYFRSATLKVPFKHVSLEKIKESLFPFCEFYCPELAPLLSKIEANDYDELFRALLNLGREVYGGSKVEFVGCKNTFCEQFVAPLINTYPNIKVIQLIRDPRSVLASQNKAVGGSYPVLFALRHWRKSVAYALENMDKTDNFLLVQYEKFINDPSGEMKRICAFLGVDYEEGMVDPGRYVSKEGGQWEQNSSFGTSTKITNKFSEKWKEILNEKEIQFVEDLCEIEMLLFNYERITPNGIHTSVISPPKFDLDIQGWIKKYGEDFETNSKEMNKEMERYLLLKASSEKVSPVHLEKVFIVKDFLSRIQNFSLD
jgi:hypothetical protein